MKRLRAILVGIGLVVETAAAPLQVDEVLGRVREQYPPLLAAWIQQDIATGRVRQAMGAFDPILSGALAVRPMNYYDGSNFELMVELAEGY